MESTTNQRNSKPNLLFFTHPDYPSAKIRGYQIAEKIGGWIGNDVGMLDFRGGHTTIATVAQVLAEADQAWTETASGAALTFSTMETDLF